MLMEQTEQTEQTEKDDQKIATRISARAAPAEPVRPEKRVRLSREARIQHILAVSQRLFSTHAYDAIAIEDIAAEVGMSKGLLYHYFASKRDLYLATLRHVLAQMLQFTDLPPICMPVSPRPYRCSSGIPAWQRWCCARE